MAAQAPQASPFYPPSYAPSFGPTHQHMGGFMGGRHYDTPEDNTGIILTAAVVKNIPFNFRKEQLLQRMNDMGLPEPYAFNYHFDQGVFRGLAFANFHHQFQTEMVINSLNGLEVGGRKLRVEYKKMLPDHERERIEREKREKRGQLEEQHRAPMHQSSIQSLAAAAAAQQAAVRRSSPVFELARPDTDGFSPAPPDNTLQYFLQLNEFAKDRSREVFILSSELTSDQRQTIHIIAQNLGLHHTSIGEGDKRQLYISRQPLNVSSSRLPPNSSVGVDLHPRGLARAQTHDYLGGYRGDNLAVPGGESGHPILHGAALREVKSHANLRSFSPSPSNSLGGGVPYMNAFATEGSGLFSLPGSSSAAAGINASDNASGLINGLNSLNLTGPSLPDNGRAREAPPAVGAIGSQRPGANGVAGTARTKPDRQPRGPGESQWDSGSTGFGRTNGHMSRGSGMWREPFHAESCSLLISSQPTPLTTDRPPAHLPSTEMAVTARVTAVWG
jgi:hypothetical protein